MGGAEMCAQSSFQATVVRKWMDTVNAVSACEPLIAWPVDVSLKRRGGLSWSAASSGLTEDDGR
jgi:hypothetical protein